MRVSKIKYKELLEAVNKFDKANINTAYATIPEENDLEEFLEELVLPDSFSNKSILGVDIFQYSQYELKKQTLIPFLFKLIQEAVFKNCVEGNGYLFQKYSESKLEKDFIPTGDGGFQILDTPLHAVSLAINYELFIRYYNSYHFYPKLRKIIGPISLRYSISTGAIFQFNDNYFGPGIINCARMLSKDNLNRCLMDQSTHDWFMHTMMGVENLQFVSIDDIATYPHFALYDKKELNGYEMIFPHDKDFAFQKIISTDVQQIGEIKAKHTTLNIYNLHLQFLGAIREAKDKPIVITIGNLNLSGID
ncbi:hypothetical protein [Parvicella tangerina]|uniref:Uncharacterized protein n=1 Tax=Parvicella tangerina TaxID=2829795 RepID=A0A916JLS8_9FLAO|nr:hypothetical protein [Parvicella tangerina]CAG5079517.1 hypothetical protein CRYO30217_00964 [Parvicella tangerina]